METNTLYSSLLHLLKEKYINFSFLINELDIYNTYLKNMQNEHVLQPIFYNKCISCINTTIFDLYNLNSDIYDLEKQIFKICENKFIN